MSFEGKVVIVTGSARGLGADYAQFFAREGASVVVADKLTEQAKEIAEKISAAGHKALCVGLDVTDPASVRDLAERTVDKYGRIDGLVNNAGIWGDLTMSSTLETDPAYWDLVMAVNVKGPLLCAQAVAPVMKQQKYGRIVNISSMGAYMRGGVYCVSKLALNSVTWQLAGELGAYNVTVNGIGPGAIWNEATQRQMPAKAAFDQLIEMNCIKRPGTSSDIYAAMRFLMSDEAEWVTGQTILVNGGFNVVL
jgi:NAD(P)-dependent dehydrogenase (short-subunit alcohol dehydrogenase family)